MPKRIADKRLTDQNWDQEDNDEIPEEHLSKKADEAVLKTRIIKKARRTMAPIAERGAGVFSSFAPKSGIPSSGGFSLGGSTKSFMTKGDVSTGFKFGSKPSSEAKPSEAKPFSIFGNSTKWAKPDTSESKVSGSTEVPEVKKAPEMESLKVPEVSAYQNKSPEAKKVPEKTAQNKNTKMEFNKHLTALNQGVMKWIQQHVSENPLVDLTPIFDDYSKHLKNIEKNYNYDTDDDGSVSPSTQRSSQSTSVESSPRSTQISPEPMAMKNPLLKNFKNNAANDQSESTMMPIKPALALSSPPKNPLGDAFIKSQAPTAPKFTGFGFGKSNSSSVAGSTGGFTGFTFGKTTAAAKPDESATKPASTEANDEDAPPKVESIEVKEEGAVYSKKCKLYYMKDGYKDKGVGYLHLKPVADTNKTQLIVRADTATGTILLNVVLDPKMPAASKQGKNNVNFSCIPNPAIKDIPEDKIIPFLFRVKTSEDAEEVVEKINEMRNK